MDSVSQRRIAAAAFAIVWAIKVPLLLSADVIHFGTSCLIDAVFFVALYRASIPWMMLSKCGTLGLILGSWIMNMGLLGSQTSEVRFPHLTIRNIVCENKLKKLLRVEKGISLDRIKYM